jgi:tRNA U54 and U55 pseudouridine synthase Pus10
MQGGKHKRWQNLLYKKCPVCDGRLKTVKDKVLMFLCEEGDCNFMITAKRYAEILADENHIMRRFLTRRETEMLQIELNAEAGLGITPLDKVA